MTRDEVVRRYGAIDFASKYWPRKNKFLTMLEVPPGFPKWHVLDTQIPVRHIACNIDIAQPLLKALNSLLVKNLADKLITFDGCFNIRTVRGSSSLFSAHSYALAIDLNAAQNGLGSTHGGFYAQPEVVKCFKDAGFYWGGDFHGRKDPMHFTWTGF